MINKTRLRDLFLRLINIDSVSFNEKNIGEIIVEKLESLGLEVELHTTAKKYLEAHPHSFPNIYGILKGNVEEEPVLFSSHLDTVVPGINKKADCSIAGIIKSQGDTVLGADDISGVASIIEALTVLVENNLKHGDIEVLFTVAEEPFCEGSKYLNYDLIKSKRAYVLDLNGLVGTAALSAPSIISFEVDIIGKAAHAGFAPWEGVNALNIAVETLKEIKTGHINDTTTVNIGTIHGGSGKNIVPAEIKLTGEVRSFNHDFALSTAEQILKSFKENANKMGGVAYCRQYNHIEAFNISESEEVTDKFKKAAKRIGIKTNMIKTFGGSDGNRFNAAGIKTLVLACAMENVHTTNEYTDLNELQRAAELTLELMKYKEE